MNPFINSMEFLYIIRNHFIGFIGEKNTSTYKNENIFLLKLPVKYTMVVSLHPTLPLVSWLDP